MVQVHLLARHHPAAALQAVEAVPPAAEVDLLAAEAALQLAVEAQEVALAHWEAARRQLKVAQAPVQAADLAHQAEAADAALVLRDL